MTRTRLLVALIALLALLGAACGDDDDSTDGAEATTTTEEDVETTTAEVDETTTTSQAPAPLTVLVTNDDGIGAPGIDALVTALSAVDGLEVVIVAPAENQSGSSDKTTPGGVDSAPGTTAGGVEGTAVNGFPADAVNAALDEQGIMPDLVVSGVNEGQNIGPFASLSGTVGAARTAIRRGIPAVASSAGLGESADFDAAATLVVEWIEANRSAIEDGSIGSDTVVSFNVPGCTAGEIGDLVQVPLGTEFPEGVNVFESDCTGAVAGGETPADDVSAIIAGFATQTMVPADL